MIFKPTHKYFTPANKQKYCPFVWAMVCTVVIFICGAKIDKNVFILTAEISAVLFGFSLTFAGILFSGGNQKYLKDMKQPKYKERYTRLIKFTKDSIYACLLLMILCLIAIIDILEPYLYTLSIAWAFGVSYTILCVHRILKIMYGMLESL